MQYSVGEPRIASTLFSTTNPDNVRKNLDYIAAGPAPAGLVDEVRSIIGDSFRLSWRNS